MVHYRLTYFDIDGIAEPTRNAFRLAKIPFEDVRVKFNEWEQLKTDSNKFLFAQMPILEIDSVPFSQSVPILRYVGRLAGLYPTDNALEALKVDEIVDALGEINKKLTASSSLPESERLDARKKLAQEFIKPYLGRLEKRVSTLGTKPFAVGNQLTIADLAIANGINSFRIGFVDGVDKNIAENYPHLVAITDHVKTVIEKSQH